MSDDPTPTAGGESADPPSAPPRTVRAGAEIEPESPDDVERSRALADAVGDDVPGDDVPGDDDDAEGANDPDDADHGS
jgi:hypothetical protein